MQCETNEKLLISQKNFWIPVISQNLTGDASEMNTRKDINELSLQVTIAEVK